ncbi:hypothetical protein B0H19DRAFT_1257258 [Mycena capillaripes]|nr:hypothetical protein B0H19DRAFT_1257258 [Mycena capillaripes]
MAEHSLSLTIHQGFFSKTYISIGTSASNIGAAFSPAPFAASPIGIPQPKAPVVEPPASSGTTIGVVVRYLAKLVCLAIYVLFNRVRRAS